MEHLPALAPSATEHMLRTEGVNPYEDCANPPDMETAPNSSAVPSSTDSGGLDSFLDCCLSTMGLPPVPRLPVNEVATACGAELLLMD